MPEYDFDMGVIGGGAAGLTVTAGAARLGAKTLLVEKEENLGGDCLHYGCVPSKTLIQTARVYHLLKQPEKFGLPKGEIPPVDFKNIAGRIRAVIKTIQEHDSEERFCGLGARVEFGSPVFVDDHSIELNGSRYSSKNWVIATGSSPDVPSIDGLESTPYLTNKDIFSLDHLPDSLIILGAGPVAVEMAQAFCRLGSEVHVIQRSGQILSREDRDMADALMHIMGSEGVDFHLNAAVQSVRDLGSETEVRFKTGKGEFIRLQAEKILIALGRKPNLSGLGLDDIGVESGRKGLRVDNRLRTTQKHIYAAGDVTGQYQFTHAAGYEGGIIISNALFHLPRKVDYTFLPWCTYSDPELASIGMNEKRAEEANIDYSLWTETFKDNDRSQAEGETEGMIKMILDEKEKPLGIQILGPHAGELLGEWVAVLNGRVKLSSLASAVHPYPTLGEINKGVAGAFFTPKLFSEKVQKGLKFFFHLKGRACEQKG